MDIGGKKEQEAGVNLNNEELGHFHCYKHDQIKEGVISMSHMEEVRNAYKILGTKPLRKI